MVITKQIFTLALLLSLSCAQAAMIGLRSPEFLASMNRLPPAGGTPAWVPTNIANCIAWYQAENYSTNGTTATWTDAVNSWNLTNAAGGTSPFLTNDGTRSYISFDGTDDFLRSLSYTSSLPHEVIFAIQLVGNIANAAPRIIDAFPTSEGQHSLRLLQSSGTYQVVIGGNTDTTGNGVLSNAWQILDIYFTNNGSILYTNNITADSSIGASGSTGAGNLIVGINEPAGSRPCKMYLAEIVSYNAWLNASNRTMVYDYLTNKYKIVVP